MKCLSLSLLEKALGWILGFWTLTGFWALVAQLHLHNVNKPNKSDIKMRKIGNLKLPIPFLFFLTSIQSLSKPKKRQAHN